MGFVGSFLVGGEGGDASGICSLDDGVEEESRSDFTVGVIADVGQIERHTSNIPFNVVHELADFGLELHSVNVDDIVGTVWRADGVVR